MMGSWAFSYITASFTDKPIARVKDSACLKCHEHQSLDTAQPFEQNITFNHKLHLENPVRGVQLHCMTCHNHRTPGQYLQVDDRTCFLCHFKGAEKGQSKTGCQTCHGNPKQSVEHQGFMFNHQAYIEVGVNCGQCHTDIISGNAAVPQEACQTCHAPHTERYKDFSLVHEVHVHREEVNCFRCHDEIQHGKFGMISSLEVRCESCHAKLHTPEKQLYIGSGGLGIEDEPSRMFLAQVSCDGCHIGKVGLGEEKFGAAALRTKQESCLKCHGKGYDLMLDDWLAHTPEMLRALEPSLRQTEAALNRSRVDDSTRAAMQEARYNYDFVADGKAAHNIFYAVDLLKRSADRMNQVRMNMGMPRLESALGPMLSTPDGICNTLCHGRIARPEVMTYEKTNFPHASHSQDLDLPCTKCHDPDKHRQKFIKRDGCKECHHQDVPIACASCHWRQNDLYRGESQELGLKESPDVMFTAGVDCHGCHDLSASHSLEIVAGKCGGCHDPSYKQMLTEWAAEVQQGAQQLATGLDSARTELEEAHRVGRSVFDETLAVNEINRRSLFMKESQPLHNYAAAITEYSTLREKLAEVRARLKPGKAAVRQAVEK
jgi:Tfp pilus assembly protein PilV